MKLSRRLGSCRSLGSWPRLCQYRSFTGTVSGLSSKRSYSSKSRDDDLTRPDSETFDVLCGSSGSITVDLYNSRLLDKPNTPLFIYLPPTGSHLQETHPAIPSFLLSSSNALARINYRWNHAPSTPSPSTLDDDTPSPSPPLLTTHPSYANHPFPTPLHDTLRAYTFLTTSLLPSFSSQSGSKQPASKSTFSPKSAYYSPRPAQKISQRPLIIYGSYLGGTLAASLALTESISSKQRPYSIAGLIVKDGIFDWTKIGTSLPPEPLSEDDEIGRTASLELASTRGDEFHWDSKTLHALKTKLFASPAGTFDAFASPVLFFRTSGLDVPSMWPGSERPTASSTTSEDSAAIMPSSLGPEPLSLDSLSDSDFDSDAPATLSPGSTASTPKVTTLSSATAKAHLKFPPRDSGLKIPRTLLISTLPPSPETPPPPQSPTPKRKSSSKSKSKSKPDSVTPAVQAYELGTLMQRSVGLHEFKERKEWDEDFDAEAAVNERVVIYEIGRGSGAEVDERVGADTEESRNEDSEEEAVVKAWIEGSLG